MVIYSLDSVIQSLLIRGQESTFSVYLRALQLLIELVAFFFKFFALLFKEQASVLLLVTFLPALQLRYKTC